MPAHVVAAVDLGASSGRVMAGRIDGDSIDIETVHRFPNGVVEIDGHLRWRMTALYDEVLAGLDRVRDAESIGVDTWGVDYGLLDAEGQLLAEPVAYRDDRTSKVVDDVHTLVPRADLYAITGTQVLPINTIYQLAAEQRGPLWARAAHVVLLPDLIAYWLTGTLATEVTVASTTGLLDVSSQQWAHTVFDRLGIVHSLLPAIERPGAIRGTTAQGTPVTTVGSHDTASAIAAVPATSDRFAYVSSGTWSLVGVECDSPVLTDAARAANFTNEIGIDGRIRFLRNVGGLWLLQECMREWGRHDVVQLVDAAATIAPGGPMVDVDDPAFVPPGRMPERIAAAAGRPSMTEAATIRCILDSLAAAFAQTVRRGAELASHDVDVIHIVGGGAQNALLCQLTANAAGLPVLAGPVEATALGNVVVQARALGALPAPCTTTPASLDAIRARIAVATPPLRYEPA